MVLRILSEAWINLVSTRQRSALALLGIVIGTASVIALLNIGTIVEHQTLSHFRELGTNVLVVEQMNSGAQRGIRPETVRELPQAVESVRLAAPLIEASVEIRVRSAHQYLQAVGTLGTLHEATRFRLAAGRFITDEDGVQLITVLGAGVAAHLSATTGEPIKVGDTIFVNGVGMSVAGILEPKTPNGMVGIRYDEAIFVPLRAIPRLVPRNDDVSRTLLIVHPEADPIPVIRQVESYFQTLPRPITVFVQSARQLLETMEHEKRLLTLMLGAVGGIALLVGGVGVMNIMLVTVSERKREIGLRLAVGARPRDVRSMFLAESFVLAIVGGIIGTGLGILASYGFAAYNDYAFQVASFALALGPGMSALVGVFFGFWPATQASRLDPIDALRAE